jgi:hypothetical protein
MHRLKSTCDLGVRSPLADLTSSIARPFLCPHHLLSASLTPRRFQHRLSEMHQAQARGRSHAHDTISRPVSQHQPRTPELMSNARHGHPQDPHFYRHETLRQSGTYDSNEIYNNPRFSDVYDPNGKYGPPGSISMTDPDSTRYA